MAATRLIACVGVVEVLESLVTGNGIEHKTHYQTLSPDGKTKALRCSAPKIGGVDPFKAADDVHRALPQAQRRR
jgi:hypothetical protein